MKKIMLFIISIILALSLFSCKKGYDTDESKKEYCEDRTFSYGSFEHFYLDLQLSQKDKSSAMCMSSDIMWGTYIPELRMENYEFTSVRVDRQWFLYDASDISDNNAFSNTIFQVRVYRKEDTNLELKEKCNGQKYYYTNSYGYVTWTFMIDEYVAASISYNEEKLGIDTFEEVMELVSFRKFDSTDFYGYEE